jgi:CubicO group peptidase (beta-lactamase class C family)
MVAGALAEAVDWLVAALSGTATGAADRVAPALTARGDVLAYLGRNPRFAGFREHPAELEELGERGPWAARAALRTGELRWELDVAVEPDPPHRIRSFQPRPVAPDAVGWGEVAPRLRGADHCDSRLDDERTDRIRDLVAAAVEREHLVGVVVGLAVAGETVFEGCWGLADPAAGTPLRFRSVFGVGSVTKVVTALAVRRLAVDLDAPVARYLPVPALDGGDPTVADLLLHRGGLPKQAPVRRDRLRAGAPLAELLPRIALPWPSGGRTEYSNLGYGLLGALVEAVAGVPFARFCGAEVLERHGLADTTVQEPGVPAPTDVVGHRVAAGRIAPAPPAAAPFPAAGGMTSSAADLLALLRAVGPVERTAPAGPGVRFAPGLAVLDRPEGALFWRGGAADGFTAELLAPVDGSCAVVVLASTSPPDGVRDLATALLAELRRA